MVGADLLLVVVCGLAFALALGAEALHAARLRRLSRLAFGPQQRPAHWVRGVPFLRAAAIAALAWGLGTLITVTPKKHSATENLILRDGDYQHVLLVLDVSPSMRLVDAGPSKVQSRMQRARDVMESFFKRVPLELYRITVVAVYNGAKTVVLDTTDIEVVRNILGDLPMHYAFPSGKTRLFDGLEEAAKIARPWNPKSTTVILVSDGDTVPAQGMPKMPASVGNVLVVGVGDPVSGKFIDGKQSRQEVSTLRQIAMRLGGTFHNGNEKHLSSTLIGELTEIEGKSVFERLTRREYALLCCGAGAAWLALLPLLLHFLGTGWRPGRPA
ncbi:MAG: VWA domain-containing protein, partial [Planctomycetota bacterium]|nr:VWA domain-containing protein [Planctomycetota bacterium]